MRKYILEILCCLLLIPTSGYSQRSSPIFGVINSNSLIDQPIEFRKMQFGIDKALKDVKPGIQIDLLYRKSEEFRKEILSELNIITLNFDTKRNLLLLGENRAEIKDSSYLKDMLSSLKTDFVKNMQKIITKAFQNIPNNKVQDAIAFAILNAFDNMSFINPDGSDNGENVQEKLGNRIANLCFHNLMNELPSNISGFNPYMTLWVHASNKDTIIAGLSSSWKQIINNIQEKIVNALNKADDEVAKAINGFSSILIAGNTGLAVTEGEGDLSGGITIGFTLSESFQLGAYLNSKLTRSDSAQPGPFQLGIQGRYADNNTQYDILASYILGDTLLNHTFSAWEVGVGISTKIKDIVIGGALIGQAVSDSQDHHPGLDALTIGFTFRMGSSSSPALTIGYGYNYLDQKGNPIFQLGIPLVGSK